MAARATPRAPRGKPWIWKCAERHGLQDERQARRGQAGAQMMHQDAPVGEFLDRGIEEREQHATDQQQRQRNIRDHGGEVAQVRPQIAEPAEQRQTEDSGRCKDRQGDGRIPLSDGQPPAAVPGPPHGALSEKIGRDRHGKRQLGAGARDQRGRDENGPEQRQQRHVRVTNAPAQPGDGEAEEGRGGLERWRQQRDRQHDGPYRQKADRTDVAVARRYARGRPVFPTEVVRHLCNGIQSHCQRSLV